MSKDRKTLFIIDDNIPQTPEYIEQSLYNDKIDATKLEHLLSSAKWTGQHNLMQLTSLIINSEHAKTGELETWGFVHPSLCLDSIDDGLLPDIIIYDWEYGSETSTKSSNWLLEILSSTEAFVFVYSMVRNTIPPFLNKTKFDNYSYRFQLFLKGDIESSVFSSEEFILQYIMSQIAKTNRIKVQGIDITFQENGYLDDSSGILFLERMFGRRALIEKLKNSKNIISQESIEEMIGNIEDEILLDKKRNLLISPTSSLLLEKYKPESKLTYLETLKKYGLQKLVEVLEIGLVKV